MPLVAPLAEIEGMGAEDSNDFAVFEVGVVEISPLPLALNENAYMLSGAPVSCDAPPQ
jgi:hypothetical protein